MSFFLLFVGGEVVLEVASSSLKGAFIHIKYPAESIDFKMIILLFLEKWLSHSPMPNDSMGSYGELLWLIVGGKGDD